MINSSNELFFGVLAETLIVVYALSIFLGLPAALLLFKLSKDSTNIRWKKIFKILGIICTVFFVLTLGSILVGGLFNYQIFCFGNMGCDR